MAVEQPAEDQLRLAECVAQKLRQGAPYSIRTFEECYFGLVPPGAVEAPEVSAKWVEVLWARLQRIPQAELARAHEDRRRLAQLVYEVWGKAV